MHTTKSIDKELIETETTHFRLYNKQPMDYDELLRFNNLLSEILKTYDVTYDQIDKDIILKYKKLTDA